MKSLSRLLPLAAMVALVFTSAVFAQPLVTGDLSVYYDFDSFVDEVSDGSANGVQAVNGDVIGNVFQSQLAARGTGSAHFRPGVGDPTYFPNDYVHIDGANVDPSLIPREGYTLAAWVNLIPYTNKCSPSCAKDQNQSIFQPRSTDGSFVNHSEMRADGRLRMKLRGDLQGNNINSTDNTDLTGGSVGGAGNRTTNDESLWWPWNEWFHFAGTYDKAGNAGLGSISWYVNGVLVKNVVADGTIGTGGTEAGPIDMGDWGQGADVGRVPDENRALNGWMDELYVYKRALTGAEIATLAGIDPGDNVLSGDMDDDDDVDFDDIGPFVLALNNPVLYESDFGQGATADGSNLGPALQGGLSLRNSRGDFDGDSDMDFDDIPGFVATLSGGGTAAVPEPAGFALAGMGFVTFMGYLWRLRRTA